MVEYLTLDNSASKFNPFVIQAVTQRNVEQSQSLWILSESTVCCTNNNSNASHWEVEFFVTCQCAQLIDSES